jgi:hypothetical protein
MHVSPQTLVLLEQLRAKAKFSPEQLYPGAPDERARLRCEATVNRFLDEIRSLLSRDASREAIIASAKRALDEFAEEDTEEFEQADSYVGEAMRAIEIHDWADET